jgi:ribA/ribD-fused uncharacterized protein
MDTLLAKIVDLQTNVVANGDKLTSLTKYFEVELNKVNHRVDQVECVNDRLKYKVNILTTKNDMLQSKLAVFESEDYKCRLKVINVPEKKHEHPKMVVEELLAGIGVDITPRTILYAYRIGRFNKEKTRPITVKFHHPLDRQLAWQNRSSLTGPIYLRQEFPDPVANKRRVLQPIVNYARNTEHFKDNAYLKHDRLVVANNTYSLDTLHKLPNELQTIVGCTNHEDFIYFYGMQSPLSNFYPCQFSYGETDFNCVEQAFFYIKALYYKKHEIASHILDETHPRHHKKLGESFGQKDWNDPTEPLRSMAALLVQKFSQNTYLTSVLLSTGDKQLVEANPYDDYWGTGCSERSCIAANNNWHGNNTMGDILMDVRSQLHERVKPKSPVTKDTEPQTDTSAICTVAI